MRLTNNFTLAELCATQTGLRNVPEPGVIPRLRLLAEQILQPLRDHVQRPVIINSGYRSPQVNAAVKGARNSQHVQGYAVDLEVPPLANGDVADWIRDNLDFDQLILENYTPGQPSSGWVHVSYRGPRWNRRNVLTWTPRLGYREGLIR